MPNQNLTNKQGSIVALAPLLDIQGNTLVLQPKGMKGDTKEVDAETADNEIVQRVKKANWIDVKPVNIAQHTPAPTRVRERETPPVEPVPAPEPTPPPAAVTPEPEPAPVTTLPEPAPLPPAEPAAVTPEPAPVTPTETTVSSETPHASSKPPKPSRSR